MGEGKAQRDAVGCGWVKGVKERIKECGRWI